MSEYLEHLEHLESLIMDISIKSVIGHSISRLEGEARYFVDIWNNRGSIKERYYISKDEVGYFEGVIKRAYDCKKMKRDERNKILVMKKGGDVGDVGDVIEAEDSIKDIKGIKDIDNDVVDVVEVENEACGLDDVIKDIDDDEISG